MFWGKGKRERIEPHLTAAGANGFGKPFHRSFSWHPLPDAGAQQFSWDTLCLPKYSPIGGGPGNRRQFQMTAESLQPLHGVTLQAIGAPGVYSGQFVAQPLTDITSNNMPARLRAAYAGSTLAPGSYMLPG